MEESHLIARRRRALRAEFHPLGDAAGNNGGNGCGKGCEEKEFDKAEALKRESAVRAGQGRRAVQELHAVGDEITDGEIDQR